MSSSFTAEQKSKFWTTYLLGLFFGIFGAHRFYNKSPKSVLMLVTFGGLGVWTLVDVINILRGKFRDSAGKEIANPSQGFAWSVLAIACIVFGASGSGEGSRDMNQYKSSDGNSVITISLKSTHANVIVRGMSAPIALKWVAGSGGIGLTREDGTLFEVLTAKEDTKMKDGYPVTMVDSAGTIYNLVR